MSGVSFYWLPAEEATFFDYLEGTASMVALLLTGVPETARHEPMLLRDLVTKCDPDFFVFGRAEDAAHFVVTSYEHQGQRLKAIDLWKSPVLRYDRGRLLEDRKHLTMSTLSGHWSYPAEDRSHLVSKDKSFVKWAQKVIAWVRRATPKEHLYQGRYRRRVSVKVEKALAEGVQIVE